MPYVPPKDRQEILDVTVEELANYAASIITVNFSVTRVYKATFIRIAETVFSLAQGKEVHGLVGLIDVCDRLAVAIYKAGKRHNYEGAFLGELNYAITRLIQRVPQIKVARGDWKETDELRYWLYACTVSALIYASRHTENFELGIDGVFEDIKDEYKWRVNRAYEVAQIVKNGDCYYTPFYTKLVEVVDKKGKHVGYIDIPVKRSEETLHKDVLDFQLVLRKK